ncbi:MAG: polysaccharide biosynthesis/export family protein [Pyrinomonadaceae bacterium]|nr:polysaccharide biosynthesis/export family protein [Pyrinomonadaceae bacterium]
MFTASRAALISAEYGNEQMRLSVVLWNTIKRISRHVPLAALLLLGPTAAWSAYKLQPGDVLEVSITGAPELRQRSAIGLEGDMSIPLAGQMEIRGLTVSEAREKIVRALSNKVYQQRTPDGREVAQLILPDAIIVSVADYRPVYLNGDVSKPGEQPFRPGMTVRHAVAVAGGYDALQMRGQNPLFQRVDLRADYEALWTEFAREQARIWRLRTELGYKDAESPKNKKIPISPDVVDQLIKTEEAQLQARNADRQKERSHLEASIKGANAQLDVLAEKKKKDEESVQADAADFEAVRQLFQKGMTATTRLSEARRAAVLSSTQMLQTVVEITNIERQRGEFTRLLDKLDTQARMDSLKELQDANLRLEQISTRLQSTSEKLRVRNGRPDIWVYRKTEAGTQNVVADEDMELLPGDVVNITLQTENPALGQ